jgi:hypothetical protein
VRKTLHAYIIAMPKAKKKLRRTRNIHEEALAIQACPALNPSGQLSSLKTFVSLFEASRTMQALC